MVNKLIIIISLIVLISVHIIEIIGFSACDLCLKQRWAWYLALIIASIPFIITINFNKVLLSIISIVLFSNAIFSELKRKEKQKNQIVQLLIAKLKDKILVC